MVTTNQINYVAGILEGEGCFMLNGDSPRIQLGMTDEDVVTKVRNIVQFDNYVHKHNSKLANRKTIFRFAIQGAVAIQWMMTIYPLMGKRRKGKIREILKVWHVNNSYRPDNRCQRNHELLKYGKDFRYDINSNKCCLHCRKISRGLRKSLNFSKVNPAGKENFVEETTSIEKEG